MRVRKNKAERNQYGLSQQQIADFTGVSRSHLAHYEAHRRELPPAAKEKHTQLLGMMAKVEKGKTIESWQPHPASLAGIKLVKEKFAFQKGGARRILGKIKEDYLTVKKKYAQTRDLIELIETMQKGTTIEKNKGDFLWLEVQYDAAVKKLRTCDEAVQLAMRIKIAALEAVVNVEF